MADFVFLMKVSSASKTMRMRSPCLLNFIKTSVFFSARRDPVMSKASDRTIIAVFFNRTQSFSNIYSLKPLSQSVLRTYYFIPIIRQKGYVSHARTKKGEISLALAE